MSHLLTRHLRRGHIFIVNIKLKFPFVATSVCADNHGCEFTCDVIDGQDTCTCERGYELSLDGLTCSGKVSYHIKNGVSNMAGLRVNI